MFCDEVKVQFIAGRGGNGCTAFRREKFVPMGGPSGGEGGRGGSIYLVADENINTLTEFNAQKVFRAGAGENGKGKDQGGRDAEDLFLHVPVGTMILDEKKKKLLDDLKRHGDKFLAARGGRGGFGNAHFKTSVRQAPSFAELGEPGEELTYILELKLVADVGIIGLPSVGKSTLLSRISNARPKIADYPFTTIVPNLGLVALKQFGGSLQQNFLACDLPGLIEGAHKGKGLGLKFLKHVARNRVLIHLLDVNSENPLKDFRTIMAEMKRFDRSLAKKPQIVAFNKIDTVDEKTLELMQKEFQKKTRTKKVFAISSVTGKNLQELIFAVWKLLEQEKMEATPAFPSEEKGFKIWKPAEEGRNNAFQVKLLKKRKLGNLFEVTGPRIEQIAVMTNFKNPEAVARVYDVLEKMGVTRELKRQGAIFGDEIRIRNQTILYRWE